MRKNKMMRIASVLLVAVLLSTSVISGTFAKYTTSSTGSDTARVAYWGWDAPATIDIDMFDANYENNAVLSSGEVDGFTNVIAPGTSKTTTFAFGYTNYNKNNGVIGAPEVAYQFTVNPTIEGDYDSLDENENFYWTLKKGENGQVETFGEVADLLARVKRLSGDDSGTKTYAAGQLPTAFTSADEVYYIGWVWAFETETDAEQDADDTKLGNALTNNDGVLENVTFSITITATQVETAPATTGQERT